MKTSISILIPTFNDICIDTVRTLQRQAQQAEGLTYEILVADDGSTQPEVVAANMAINDLPHCRYIVRHENVGRAAIRNFLASSAINDWLLFIDSGMGIGDEEFLNRYIAAEGDVVCGGYRVEGDGTNLSSNLRFLYEKAAESSLLAENRRQEPHHNFHTSNFLIEKSIYLAHPLDTRFRRYGYEDVLMGKQLQMAGIGIEHIDNPVVFNRFEENARFMEKTEEAIQTLCDFSEDLSGFSRLLATSRKMKHTGLSRLFLLIYKMRKNKWRSNLCGPSPSLFVFKCYKLGYLLTLDEG